MENRYIIKNRMQNNGIKFIIVLGILICIYFTINDRSKATNNTIAKELPEVGDSVKAINSTIAKDLPEVGDRIKQEMFCEGVNNLSIAPNYIVVLVKNKNTGEKKEICTEAPFLLGALEREDSYKVKSKGFIRLDFEQKKLKKGISNDTKGVIIGLDCNELKNRYFEFSNEDALDNISFDLYSTNEIDSFAKTVDIKSMIENTKTGELTSMNFQDDMKMQIMFAHVMFNHGVMMTRGCIAGNICGLSYFKSKK